MSDDQEIKVQSLTKLYILVLLKANKSISGYSILKRLDKDLGKTASPTHVYDFLKKLKAEEYIVNVENPKSKRSKGFQITNNGEKFTDRIFARFNNLIEVAVQSKLKACASCGVMLYDNYYSETIGTRELIFCCEHCAMAYKNSNHKH